MNCTFFGHRDMRENIQPQLERVLRELIEHHRVDAFYVGNNGKFDLMTKRVLEKLQEENTNIRYYIVLAYMPTKNDIKGYFDFSNTIYPEILEQTPPKYAINKRNEWMINNSDYVVTFVNRTIGGAAKFKEIAVKKGKYVIELSELHHND